MWFLVARWCLWSLFQKCSLGNKSYSRQSVGVTEVITSNDVKWHAITNAQTKSSKCHFTWSACIFMRWTEHCAHVLSSQAFGNVLVTQSRVHPRGTNPINNVHSSVYLCISACWAARPGFVSTKLKRRKRKKKHQVKSNKEEIHHACNSNQCFSVQFGINKTGYSWCPWWN